MVSRIKTSQNQFHLPFSETDFVAAQNNDLCNIYLSNLSNFEISQKLIVCKMSVERVDVHSNGQETGIQYG